MSREHPTVIPEERFVEVQPMHRNPVIRYMLPMSTLTAAIILLAVYSQQPDPMIPAALGLIVTLDLLVMFGLSLRTVVTDRELIVRFRPFRTRRIPLAEIEEAEAVKYSPLADAGGWGVRASRKFGKVLNVSGDRGVRITAGRTRMLIGSGRAEELEGAIKSGRKSLSQN